MVVWSYDAISPVERIYIYIYIDPKHIQLHMIHSVENLLTSNAFIYLHTHANIISLIYFIHGFMINVPNFRDNFVYNYLASKTRNGTNSSEKV